MVITTFTTGAVRSKLQQIKDEDLSVSEKRQKINIFVKTNKKAINSESRLFIGRLRYWLKDQKKIEKKYFEAQTA